MLGSTRIVVPILCVCPVWLMILFGISLTNQVVMRHRRSVHEHVSKVTRKNICEA